MLKKRIMPCLLMNDWLLAKTIKFGNLRNLGNPTQAAKVYNMRNVDELVFLDIKASRERREHNYDLIAEISDECFMPLTIGGGVRTIDHIYKLLKAGADKVSINTAAVENPKFIMKGSKKFGAQCIVVSIDAKKTDKSYEVVIHSGTKATGLNPVDWAEEVEELGAGEILLTSIDRDGTMEGYDIELTRSVAEAVSIPVIAVGGAGTPQHFVDVLTIGKADASGAASIFQYTQYSPVVVREYVKNAGVDVRIDVGAEHLTGSELIHSVS